MSEIKRYVVTCDCMREAAWGDFVRHDDYEREIKSAIAAGIRMQDKCAALEAECDTLRQQRDKLARVLESVEREHGLIRQMKNCEIRRGRGSFGIAVISDTLAIEWQAFDKELQQLIDVRHAALSELNP